MQSPSVTLDDLVMKLRNVRCEMSDRRLFKRVAMKDIWGSDSDSDSDSEKDKEKKPRRTTKKTENIEKDRNTVYGTLAYFNSNLCIGIQRLTPDHLLENNVCNIMHDLANIPLPMVLNRLQNEGCTVEK